MNLANTNIIAKVCLMILVISFINKSNIEAQFVDNSRILNVVISNEIILNLKGADAQAAMEFTMKNVLSDEYEDIDKIKPEIVNSFDEITDRIEEKKADIIGISSFDFFEYKNELTVTPIFFVQRGKEPGTKYVIVTNNNSNINSLSDLKSKKILTFADNERRLVNYWLFVEMKKAKINMPDEIVDLFVPILKPTKRVFSVFFDKADGCILTKEQFEIMCEINPQLKKKLKILYESPLYLTNIFCSNNNSTKAGIQLANKFINEMNQAQSGAELLKLFKAFKFKNFEDNHLLTIEKLFEEYSSYQIPNK